MLLCSHLQCLLKEDFSTCFFTNTHNLKQPFSDYFQPLYNHVTLNEMFVFNSNYYSQEETIKTQYKTNIQLCVLTAIEQTASAIKDAANLMSHYELKCKCDILLAQQSLNSSRASTLIHLRGTIHQCNQVILWQTSHGFYGIYTMKKNNSLIFTVQIDICS